MAAKKTAAPPQDRRVRRTRRQLRDALVSLILERGWDDVSLVDVCARADVGRSTLYTHFADKEDLLLSGFDDLHASLGMHLGQPGTFGFIAPLVEHARENVKLFRAVVGRRSGQSVQRRFRDVVTQLVEVEIAAFGVDADQRAFVARYVSGGFVELLVAWIERPSSMESAALAASFRRLTLGAIAGHSRPDVPL
jgi:AcrR family transcriptional regulator